MYSTGIVENILFLLQSAGKGFDKIFFNLKICGGRGVGNIPFL